MKYICLFIVILSMCCVQDYEYSQEYTKEGHHKAWYNCSTEYCHSHHNMPPDLRSYYRYTKY
jgi:hypothetical protein